MLFRSIIDWPSLVPLFRKTRAEHIVTEHDNPSDLDRVIGRSIAAFNSY